MQYILSLLPLLACPLGMGLLMWFIMRTTKSSSPDSEREMTPRSPLASPTVPAPARKTTRSPLMSLFGMCLDWRVIVGLALVGVGVWVFAPRFILAALPLLLLAICPLSMVLMMLSMRGTMPVPPARPMQASLSEHMSAEASLSQEERRARIQERIWAIQAEQEQLTHQMADIQQSESPIWNDGASNMDTSERPERVK